VPAPYTALTGFKLTGPRFVPFSLTLVPPLVGRLVNTSAADAADSAVIAGRMYDVVTLGAVDALRWPPTVTRHT
jgi:hypothetical protein